MVFRKLFSKREKEDWATSRQSRLSWDLPCSWTTGIQGEEVKELWQPLNPKHLAGPELPAAQQTLPLWFHDAKWSGENHSWSFCLLFGWPSHATFEHNFHHLFHSVFPILSNQTPCPLYPQAPSSVFLSGSLPPFFLCLVISVRQCSPSLWHPLQYLPLCSRDSVDVCWIALLYLLIKLMDGNPDLMFSSKNNNY